jgi:hypothetical protein
MVVSDAKVIVGSYTCLKHDACIARLHNEGRLNRVLELTGLTYGPRLVPSSDASIEASKKRKAYSVGKVVVKRPKAPEKKRVETSAPWGKGRFKRLSNVEVASAKPIKLSKKNAPHAIAATAAAHGMLGASSPKSAAGALSSKILGGTSGSKLTALNLRLVRKTLRGHQKMSCSHDWSYGGGIFERVSGVFATWSDDRGLNAANCPMAGTSWLIFSSVVAQFGAKS